MSNSVDSFVQVAPDSTGKKIRNLQITILQPDGSLVTTQMQVTAISDADGNIYDPFDQQQIQLEILSELKMLRKMVAKFTNSEFEFIK